MTLPDTIEVQFLLRYIPRAELQPLVVSLMGIAMDMKRRSSTDMSTWDSSKRQHITFKIGDIKHLAEQTHWSSASTMGLNIIRYGPLDSTSYGTGFHFHTLNVWLPGTQRGYTDADKQEWVIKALFWLLQYDHVHHPRCYMFASNVDLDVLLALANDQTLDPVTRVAYREAYEVSK